MKNRKSSFWFPLLFFTVFLIGALSMYLFINWASPTGWILQTKGSGTENLTYSEMKLLRNLLNEGHLFTTSDILENFTAYYHMLISFLITILVLLAGLVTYNFYRSRNEYKDLMERELKEFLKEYERDIYSDDNPRGIEEIDKYEELQKWLKKQIFEIIYESSDFLASTVKEAIVNEFLNDTDFLDQLKQQIATNNMDAGVEGE